MTERTSDLRAKNLPAKMMWGCQALCSDLQIVGNVRKCVMGGKRGIITTITTFVEWLDMKLLVKCATFLITI